MINLENTMLVVIDVQGNLAQAMYEKELLFKNIRKIVRGAQILEMPIVVTEQVPEKLGPTLPEIAGLFTGIQPITKSSFSCCGNDDFVKELKTVTRGQILVTGIEAHVCVYQTTIDLINSGYEVNLVADCISSRTLMNKTIGIESMVNKGAILTSTEMALFELMKIAEGDAFSQIIKIVDSTILDAINKQASDIHIEASASGLIIRYRIDGMLHQATDPLDIQHLNPIISRIKVMSELDISEKRIPQDGRFKLKVMDRYIDFRISILPTINGENAVIRILDRDHLEAEAGKF